MTWPATGRPSYVHLRTFPVPSMASDDPELQRRMGGLTLDDAGPTIAPVVFAIDESALEPGLLWVGSNDGLVRVQSSDERPTEQQVAVYEMLRDQLEALETRYETEGLAAVADLNRLLRERGVPHVIGGRPAPIP